MPRQAVLAVSEAVQRRPIPCTLICCTRRESSTPVALTVAPTGLVYRQRPSLDSAIEVRRHAILTRTRILGLTRALTLMLKP